MRDNKTVLQAARWVALGALFLIPFTPLVVANPFFFPFITGKAFYVRILIEIAVIAWVALAFFDTHYRPRFSWIGVAVVSFVGWMFIADAFALNAMKAFWSNFERMEGWVLLVHLLGFFFASSAILRAEKKWRAWFFTSLGVSVIICGYALLQLDGRLAIHQGSTRLDATLGNSAYLAVYLLFSVFVSLWLALTEKRQWLQWALVLLAVLQATLLLFTETRGAVIGLVVSLSLAALLTVFTGGKHIRRIAVGALVLIALLGGGLYLARHSDFVKNNHTLQRITSISLQDGQVRFTLWGMALSGVMESPIVGWGQEGYNYVFNKYYEPSLFKQEQWFDRAHNTFVDWLVAGGIPAFLLYLALFGTALVLLWTRSELARPERIMLTAVLVGYAIHNFFVFDNVYSYVYFFAILALIDSQVARPMKSLEHAPRISASDSMTVILPVVIFGCALIWFVNAPGIRVATTLITALSPTSTGIAGNVAIFESLVARPSFAGQEVREQLVDFSFKVVQAKEVPDDLKLHIATLARDEMKKEVALHPQDARAHLQLSLAERLFGNVDGVLGEMDAAIALSPKKSQFYLQKGMIEFELGRFADATKTLDQVYAFSPPFPDIAKYAALGRFAAGNIEGGNEILSAYPEIVGEVEAIIKELSKPKEK